MADKTPVRVVFNASNVATGMAEFQTGETVPVANGGTGLSSLGSAGQVLRTNAAGNALEFATLEDLADIISVGSTLTAPSNADFNITTAGTGNIVLNDLSISDNTLSTNRSNDDLNINASGTGTVVLENLKIGTSGSTVTTILDEDNMSTNSATALATQQSIKAYVDSEVGSVSTTAISQLNSNVTVADAGSGTITVTVDGSTIGTFNASGLQLGGSGARVTTVLDEDGFGTNSDTALATQQSIKAYVDAQITAEDLDVTADDSTAIAIDLDSEVLHFAGGNGISTSVSGNTVTTAIDSGTVVTLTDSQTLTNKVLTNPTINAFSGTGNGSITGTLSLVTTTTGDSFLITTTEDSNSAAPVITLKRNSSSPADADYLGRLNFKGENDADQAVTYARISGKILDASDGTEDGAIEFNTIKAGSATITARLNSDELKLLNGTSLDVNGAGTFAGIMTATSVTSNDFTSNGSNADITIAPQGTGNINLTAGADVVIPANIGIILDGTGAEKIESDGTDISISVGSNGDINIPADIGLTFGDDGEKIEGDGTDLTITGNNIKLTATADVIIPTNVGLHFTDANEKIESDGSKLVITSGGTAFNFPTADGTSGQALVTDGAGNLSFDSVSTTVSDDTLATVRNNKSLGSAARTIDSINATFIDSAFYFLVQNDIVNEVVSAELFAVTNNDSASFLGNRRGIESSGGSTVPTLTTDVTNGQFRVRATGSSSECKASFYKVAMSSSTADATRGNTVTSSNTDVDSASESIDTFAHATFRGAKYFISVDNDSKTEMDVVEALVVHDGSDAFINSYGHTRSGSNPLITLTAAISGDNVVVSAAGLEPNLNITMHKILLKDNMTAESNANQKAFAAVTISSTATAIDLMDIDDANGAVYFIVGANSSEGAFSIQEVYTAATPGIPAVANGPFVSTKASTQIEFTAEFDTSSENSLELFASSTSGGSTTVSGYRISALAG